MLVEDKTGSEVRAGPRSRADGGTRYLETVAPTLIDVCKVKPRGNFWQREGIVQSKKERKQ